MRYPNRDVRILEYVTIKVPKLLIRFFILFYGVWCGSLWATLMGLGLFILKNKDPFWSPIWQPQTANASIAFLTLFLLGLLSVIFGQVRIFQITKSHSKDLMWPSALLGISLPVMALFVSHGIFHLVM